MARLQKGVCYCAAIIIRLICLQALTRDIQPPPELAATIAILFYPTSTAEAAAAKHAREFAMPFGKISALLVKRHASKGLYALVTFCQLEAAAEAVAAELTPPVNAHLPRVVHWTNQLKAEFAGESLSQPCKHTGPQVQQVLQILHDIFTCSCGGCNLAFCHM